ncbi:ATP-binding protein [Rhodanobacter sp. DHG33]|uniref:ATP-binding protein n=1 Tax=Rhodanobacter sp. DHG33 TaxID=2775921 RepID=UPI00178257C7|nr:two-component sensor histidine kinase [Rhodanobacter sp. DHG33]
MGALSFYQFRAALSTEIAANLRFGASTIMQRIDTLLFSHIENMRVWSGLEVMQDIRVNDVDKRLSHFLADLHAGQGSAYTALLCTDERGRVVAASQAAYIGTMAPVAKSWQAIPGSRLGGVSLARVHDADGDTTILRTAIPNAFGEGSLGYLYAVLDRHVVQQLLDDAVNHGPRSLLLLDQNGHVIAASAALRARIDVDRLTLNWRLPDQGVVSYVRDGNALGYGTVLVGVAKSEGYQQFQGLGWRIVMVEPTTVSFGPIWRLLWAMLAVLVLTLMAGLWISSHLAHRIALPIMTLTDFTRSFRQRDVALAPLPTTNILEVQELHRAYAEMIDDLAKSREQVVRAGKLAVVGEMAAIMAHEVRTPLGILRNSAQLLQRQPELGEREHELIGFIFSETERLNRLVTLLLECARPTQPDFRPHDLHAIIDSVLNLLASRAEKSGVSLSCSFAEPELIFLCDREQIMQVLLNLVLNALAFVGDRGCVQIATRLDGSVLHVSVMDDGPGVPPALRQAIFDPFFSRREGGIGLGLTIVQQVVHVHGGEVVVGESPWGGASFNLTFAVNGLDR